MRFALNVLSFLACLMLPGQAFADMPGQGSPISVFLSAATLGAGAGLGYRAPGGLFGVRGSVNIFHFDINFDESGSRERAQANLQNESILVDLYPTRKNFHVTAGVIFNQNSANISATPQLTGTLLSFIKKSHYNGAVGNVTGPISFNPVAPYLGLGYDFNAGNHWLIRLDAGAMYQGDGRIVLTPSGLLAANPKMRAEVTANARRADNMIDKMSFYPVISVQICYRF